jgi:hypothetical protein
MAAATVRAATPVAAGGWAHRRRIRRPVDPHSLCLEPSSGSRQTEEAWRAACEMAVVLGESTTEVDWYLIALSAASPEHLRAFRRWGGVILFAPTIPDALASSVAAVRRGRPLTPAERAENMRRYSRAAGTLAIYDPAIDAVVLPSSYIGPDIERIVLHELGHALTLHSAWPDAAGRSELLRGLPPEIAEHIACGAYGDGRTPEGRRQQVLEVLAESYAWMVCGREEELPWHVMSELGAILSEVTKNGRPKFRHEIDPKTGRTVTRVDPSELISIEPRGDLAPPRTPEAAGAAAVHGGPARDAAVSTGPSAA